MNDDAMLIALVPGDLVAPIAPPEPAEALEEMPLPRDLHSFLLMAILIILMLYSLYFIREIVLPVIFAFVLYLLLQPSMRWFAKLHVPKTVAALMIICAFFGGLTALGFSLSGPAATWIAKAPESLPHLEKRLSIFKKPVEDMQKASKEVERMGEDSSAGVRSVTVRGPSLSNFLFSGTRALLAGLLTTIVLLFFLLVSGDLFLRRLVEILPTLSNKKQAVDISHEIESNMSGYLVTISLMNAAVGIATGLATYFCGLSDPILWGSVAFLLNYIPILGPLCGVAIIFLAVPMLATFKIVCDRIRPLMALGHFLGAEARS